MVYSMHIFFFFIGTEVRLIRVKYYFEGAAANMGQLKWQLKINGSHTAST